jgi:uncharacterized protein
MLDRGELRGGVIAFLTDATFAALSARDRAGRLWTSPVTGRPGLLKAVSPTTLLIGSTLPEGDPLHGLPDGQPIGLIVMDFAARRRVRINGTLRGAADGRLAVDVEQAYGNCPQYIQRRHLQTDPHSAADTVRVHNDRALTPEDIRLVRGSDTFFLGTTHPERGNDASHRGGPAGFVRVDGNHLWWPDYPGNNMFNSFGNLAVDPTAALLFIDFRAGHTLQLSGTAALQWGDPSSAGHDAHTGRRAHFTAEHTVAGRFLRLRQTDHSPYPRNPPLTDK